jgi:adenylate cyclase
VNTDLDNEQQIRERTFLLMVPLFAAAGLFWTIVYYYSGAKHSAIIPGSYAIFAFSSILIFKRYKNFRIFRNTQLTLILFLPFLLHLSLGDFISSSAVILWSALCPVGALAFQNSKAAANWMILFICIMIAAFLLQHKIFPDETKLPDTLISIFFALNISCVIFLIFFALRYFVNQTDLVKKELKRERTLLAIEREKSETLLLNILPSAIATRLKDGEQIIADEHQEASVLFADIVGFTNISQNISPTMLVENLNKIFTHFDKLVEQYNVEKIKTIGDAYMAVSGLNGHKKQHANKMADLALMMLSDIGKFSLDSRNRCTVRVGIHIGPVIAGVIGSKKFSYDIWGDAVNTAQRMESTCEPGKIQVSEKFYNAVKEEFDFELRGQTEVKGKGLMNLYILKGKKELTSEINIW